MVDSIRSLAELNQLFSDNVSGSISAQDIRDLMVSQMVHGEIGSGPKSAITLATGFNVLDLTVAGEVERGVNIETTNRWITGVPVIMKAEVSLEVLFQGSNNTTFTFTVFRNPQTTPVQLARMDGTVRIVSAAMIGGLKVSAAIQLQEGDTLQAGVSAGAVSFTLVRGLLRVRRIGIE